MIRFLCSGRLGDFIHQLYSVKRICEEKGERAHIVVGGDEIREAANFSKPTPEAVEDLKSLLYCQEYIEGIEAYSGQDLDSFEYHPGKYDECPLLWKSCWTSIHNEFFNFSEEYNYGPWLKVDPDPNLKGKIAIHRSRKTNPWGYPDRCTDIIDWNHLIRNNDCVFIAFEDWQYKSFAQEISPELVDRLPLIIYDSVLEFCRAIAGSKMFIGNQSSPLAMAQALDVPRLGELSNGDSVHYVGEEKYFPKMKWVSDVHTPWQIDGLSETVDIKLNMFSGNKINLDVSETKAFEYQSSDPFPHTVIDNFLPEWIAKRMVEEFKSYEDWGYDPSKHSENHQVNKFFSPWSVEMGITTIPETTKNFLLYMNSPEILEKLEKLTGISNLIPDPNYLGGGMHRIDSGGKLSVHADFMLNGVTRNFRRINLLVYLNENWMTEWGGSLQLWSEDMTQMVREVEPMFNRAVIFSTGEKTYHGHPHPLQTPEGISRYSIALYYYTEEREGYDKNSSFSGAQWKEVPDPSKNLIEKNTMKKPTICLATVCKNEERCIERLLESVHEFIDYWIVVDTGSTDRTCEIVEEYFRKKGIPGELHRDEWVSMGHNKTKMMEYAKGKTDYVIHVDSDDYIEGKVNKEDLEEGYHAFFLEVLRGQSKYKTWVIFDNRITWRFIGVAHTLIKCIETPNFSTLDLSGKPYKMISVLTGGGRSSDPEKYYKDALSLQKQFFDTLLEDPDDLNLRSIFYTAQSYMDSGRKEEAIKWYRLYTKIGDNWIEEKFEAHFRISLCMMDLGWDLNKIIVQTTLAIDIFPDRAEPLFYLGKYCNNIGEFDLGYKYLHEAKNRSLEEARKKYILFVDSSAYGDSVKDELSISCYWTGRYQEGYKHLMEIMNTEYFEPHRERILENKRHFENMMKDSKLY
jgi:glycosyltransferase involved in cell wall biosynthesis/Rps23 Pro-64 3,4-dihydroxylase Tpa1-like proline 4-hydroxylase